MPSGLRAGPAATRSCLAAQPRDNHHHNIPTIDNPVRRLLRHTTIAALLRLRIAFGDRL